MTRIIFSLKAHLICIQGALLVRQPNLFNRRLGFQWPRTAAGHRARPQQNQVHLPEALPRTGEPPSDRPHMQSDHEPGNKDLEGPAESEVPESGRQPHSQCGRHNSGQSKEHRLQ